MNATIDQDGHVHEWRVALFVRHALQDDTA